MSEQLKTQYDIEQQYASELKADMLSYLEYYKKENLRLLNVMLSSGQNKNSDLVINREKDLLIFCFKAEAFFKGKGELPEKDYFFHDFKRMFLFDFKEKMISVIRMKNIDRNYFMQKSVEFIDKMEHIEQYLS